ncbi:deoxyribose-phosphate aldolase [Sphaerodactylus townsendi]|uniref:deoxyribose-phosphate aldolase n=1 Tax=Sphaerodactylus townsendi TaxID=933632 RepID=UPI002026B356|nr:deoxyribose-phosphate aldolase [Sphaerodactylus townsendi]
MPPLVPVRTSVLEEFWRYQSLEEADSIPKERPPYPPRWCPSGMPAQPATAQTSSLCGGVSVGRVATGVSAPFIGAPNITTAAVCVYPARVADAVKALRAAGCKIPVASVATGFPAGQTALKTRLEEIRLAVEDGAKEIDIVINRTLVLTGQWEVLYEEIHQFRQACGEAHMKTILGTGELGSLTNVYKASLIAMMAGSDFIKTSTGKEAVNATIPVGLVMVRAIRDYFWRTGYKVGFKPAGGIRTAKDALTWLSLIKEELGDEWLKPELFRLGASTLLADIERQIYHHVTGRYAAYYDLPMA